MDEGPESALARLCAQSLDRALPAALREGLAPLCREIEARHDGGLGLLLYGSCLWSGRVEGVPDFVLVVEDYERAYTTRRLRIANRWLPPNVFPLFAAHKEGGPLRAKYAVVSLRDLQRGTRGAPLHCFLWARMCQPTALLSVRDDDARDAIAQCAANAIEGLVGMALPIFAEGRMRFPVDPTSLWTAGFGETYRAEWRVETRQRSVALVDADAGYYHRVTGAALARLAAAGEIALRDGEVEIDPEWARRRRRAWMLRRPVAKTLAALRLIKTALTFGDWVPYALWKMERHTGVRLEASAAQRRHPFLFGWPLIVRALRERWLR